MKNINLWLIVLTFLGASAVAHAQSITPALDSTGTIVTPAGNQFNISGGTQAGANLYQSFQQFGLDSNQIATFLSRPDIQNILGRVVGGDASVINGLVQVTGGNSNLYLLNPAGIIFGSNASLNVPASFTATTANGILVGNTWFNATGTNDYASLNGTPNGFAFTQSGSIFNAGNLTVGAGQSVTLLGGTVVNLGTIAAPGGTITIAAIPGEKLVRITQAGSLLSLDLPIDTKAQLNSTASTPLNLPALLTNSSLTNATGVTVDKGVITLNSTGAAIPTDNGVAIVSGTVSVAQTDPLRTDPPQPPLGKGGTDAEPPFLRGAGGIVNILGDKVGLLSANINASGTQNGGTILIGGDYQGKGSLPTAQFTYVDPATTIRADALTNGNGGKVILWSDQATRFLGTISAWGGALGGNGGFVETSGKVYLQALGTVDSSAVNGTAGTWLLDPNDITIQTGGVDTNVTASPNFTSTNDSAIVTTGSIEAALNAGTSVTVTTASAGANTQLGNITVANNISKTAGADATLTLNAQNSIFVNNNVQITSTNNRLTTVLTGDSDGNLDGAIVLNPGSAITSNNGNITLSGQGTAANIIGIQVNNATLTAGTGNIQLTGTGQAGTSGAHGILVQGGGDLITTTGSITLNGTGGAGTDGNRGVYIINPGTTLTSGDGNISITGVSNSTGQFNIATHIQNGATVSSTGNGNITLAGTGNGAGQQNFGLVIENAGTQVTTANGNINLTGTSNGTGPASIGVAVITSSVVAAGGNGTVTVTGTGGAASSAGSGIVIGQGTGTRITSVNGDITLTGTGNGTAANSYGINLFNDASIRSTGSGAISLTGTPSASTTQGILFQNTSGIVAGTGAVTLTADEMDFSSANSISGSGTLLLQPLTAARPITTGTAANVAGNLTLTTNDLAALQNGFTGITIGRTNSTGAIDVRASSFNDNLTIRTPAVGSSGIVFNGALAMNGNNLTLNSGGAVTQAAGGTITASGLELLGTGPYTLTNAANNITTLAGNTTGAMSYRDTDGFDVGTVNTIGLTSTGNITLNGGGAVTQSQAIVAPGLELLGTGPYTLTNAANNITTLAGNTTGAISYTDANSFTVGTVNTVGLQSQGDIALNALGNGDITVANNISKTAGGDATLTLNAQNSIFVNNGVQITSTNNRLNGMMTGDSDANGDGAIVLNPGSAITSNNGNITLSGQGTAANTTGIQVNNATLTAGTGNIQLTGTGQAGTTSALGIQVRSGGNLLTTTGNITLNGTGGAGTNFNIGVFLTDSGTSISTVDGAISITGTGAGIGTTNHGIVQANGAAVTSTGSGTITLNGTGGAGTDGNLGVFLSDPGTSISTVDGAISITGTGAGTGISNYGIYQNGTATVTSTGSGTITLNGTGGAGTSFNYGVLLIDTGTSTVDGAISITGTGAGTGTSNYGIFQLNGATVTSTGTAPITLQGTGAGTNDGIFTTGAGNSIGGASANGDITLTADRMTLNNVTIRGNRNLLIQPLTPGTTIGIGTGSTGTLNLNGTELGNLQNGFNSITIGRTNSSGAIDIQTSSFNDPTIIRTPNAGGTIALSTGTVNTNNNPLTLLAAGTVTFNNTLTTGTGDLTVTGSTLNQTGGTIATTGTANFTSTAPNLGDVTLRNSAAGGTNFGASNVGGNLTLNTAGNASSTGGALRVAGNAVINAAGTIAIPDGDDQITNLTAIGGSGTGDVVISQVGPVVLSTTNLPAAIGGNLTVNSYTTGTGFTVFNGAAITLNNATNSFGGNVSVNTVFNATPIALTGVSGITQTAGVNMTNPAATASFAAVQSATNSTPTGAITLPLNNTLGIINLRGTTATLNEAANTVLGLSTLTNDLTITSTGTITQTGALTVGANSSFNSTSLTLNSADNAFTGSIALTTTGTASLNNTLPTQLNTSTIGGTLGITSNGAITDVGNLTVTGVTSLSANSNDITLDNANDFGTVSITNTNNALLNDINSLNLGPSVLKGRLTATALTGTLSTSGAVTAGNNITLTGDSLVVNAALAAPGNLTLQPITPSRNIGIGATTGQFDLSTATLANLTNGFSGITIGRTNGTGIIQLGTPIPTFNNPVNIPSGNTLIGSNVNTTWAIIGTNSGNLNSIFPNGLTFNNISNLVGGSANDTFTFANGQGITGVINGGSGNNTLNYTTYTTPVNINLATNTATGTGGFSNIQNAIGGTGNNTLTGANTNNTFTLNSANGGNVNSTFTFANFQNLVGGNTNDTFKFLPGGSLSGNLDGVNVIDTLDYSAYTAPVTVNLATNTATGIGGTAISIENIIGNTTNTTIIGKNTNTTFNITSTNTGDVGGVNFSSVQNLIGGTGNDTFIFKDGANLTGIIDGGPGFDTLDYTAYTTPVIVNLPVNQATGTNGVFNIEQALLRPSTPSPQPLSPSPFLVTPLQEKVPEPLATACPIAPLPLQVEPELDSKPSPLPAEGTEFDRACRPQLQPAQEKEPAARSKNLLQPEALSTVKPTAR